MSQRDRIRLSDVEIRAFLAEGRTMILVSNGRDGYPHPMPMFYAVDDDLTVRFTTYEKSQKVANIHRDERVTLLVESGHDYSELKGVAIEGTAEVVKDLDLAVDTMLAARRLRDGDAPAADEMTDEVKQKLVGKRVVIRVTPRRFVSWDHSKL